MESPQKVTMNTDFSRTIEGLDYNDPLDKKNYMCAVRSLIRFFQQDPFQVMVYQSGTRMIGVDNVDHDSMYFFEILKITKSDKCRAIYHLRYNGSAG